MNEKLLTIPEVAAILRIGSSTLRRYLRRKLLSQVVLPGNDHRIREADLNAFIERRTVRGNELEGEK
ncbi:MAG: helix-turn-helix domain-containing protein [Chthoniobacterales bacterium]